jgi:hypothetical protein
MTRRKSIIGALVLCALSLCAFGAANASALGLTAVTCTNAPGGPGTGNFETSHCETPEKKLSNFETVAIPLNTTTELEGKAESVSVLGATIATIAVEVKCKKASNLSGDVTNVTVGEEMKAHGTNIVINYTECLVNLVSNPLKTCEVESITGTAGTKGTIATNPLTSTTRKEHNVVFNPEVEGANFAEFKILKGECLTATVTVKVSGSVTGIANTTKHSHITFEPATNGNEGSVLKANGGAATYTGTNSAVMKGTENTVGLTTF